MPTLAGDILRVRHFSYLRNQVGINTNHFIVTSVVGAGTLTPFNAWHGREAVVGPLYIPLLTSQAQYLGSAASWIFPLAAATPEVTDTQAAGNGTMSATPLPGQVAGIISKRTAIPGRSGRGRIFIPFPGIDAITPPLDTPNAGYVANLLALGGAMYTATWSVVLGGVTYNFAPLLLHRAAPGGSNQITGFQNQQKWGTQRRRGDYGRQNPIPF